METTKSVARSEFIDKAYACFKAIAVWGHTGIGRFVYKPYAETIRAYKKLADEYGFDYVNDDYYIKMAFDGLEAAINIYYRNDKMFDQIFCKVGTRHGLGLLPSYVCITPIS